MPARPEQASADAARGWCSGRSTPIWTRVTGRRQTAMPGANGHGQRQRRPGAAASALRRRADGRRQGLRFAMAPLAAVSTRKGRIVVRLDPAFKDDLVVGVEATDGSENVCLATQAGAGPDLPRHRGQRRRRPGPGRCGDQARCQGPCHRLRAREQEARGADGADQPRRHPDRPGHEVPGHRPRRSRATRSSNAGRSNAVLPDEAEPIPSIEDVGESEGRGKSRRPDEPTGLTNPRPREE